MKFSIKIVVIIVAVISLQTSTRAQADDICREFGLNPSFDPPTANIPYVFGKVTFHGYPADAKLPIVTVVLFDSGVTSTRITITKTGNYCFRRNNTSSAGLLLEVDGLEAGRRSLPTSAGTQQCEDFEITAPRSARQISDVVSAKFSRRPNGKTAELYRKAAEAEAENDQAKAIDFMKQVVDADPEDFIAWAKLGSLYFAAEKLTDADASFKRSLQLRIDYTPSWINVGKMRMFQKQYPAAIEIFKQAIATDPQSARAHQLLGEAYLQTKQGTLGAEALNKAIALDPVGMAESHLQLAHLYDLAGAKKLAANEYKMFLEKVPNHPSRKKFEKYIKDN